MKKIIFSLLLLLSVNLIDNKNILSTPSNNEIKSSFEKYEDYWVEYVLIIFFILFIILMLIYF